MPNETRELSFEDKTNITHQYQGNFRQGYHSLEQFNYVLKCDSIYSGNDFNKKNLSIICLDQTDEKILIDNKEIWVDAFLEVIPKFNSIIIPNKCIAV